MARKKAKKYKKRLPDLPGPDVPLYGPLGGLVGLAMRNPIVPAILGAYALAENTERFWGPPVSAHAQRTRDRFRKDTSTGIDPSSPWIIPEGWGYQAQGPMGPPAPSMQATADQPVKRTRKVTKSNKATKKAWDMLRKRMKGKMTKEKCQKLLKKCSMISSKANPNTKSRIGKGKTQTCKDARKIRKEIWGTTKRY
jgi:hypothetical protein